MIVSDVEIIAKWVEGSGAHSVHNGALDASPLASACVANSDLGRHLSATEFTERRI